MDDTSTDFCQKLYCLQIELSTVCNALCIGCVRTDWRNLNQPKPYLPKQKFLDIEVIVKCLQSDAGQRINELEFCGNVDEPLAHPNLIELLNRLYEIRPDLLISIHTNGGLGSPGKFIAISQILTRFGPTSNMRFSIDGLSDTNHLYRQNVRWDKVIANMGAAVEGGTRVIWQFVTFPWNQDQIEPARELARKMGCAEFLLRPDRSFVSTLGLEKIKALKVRNRVLDTRPKGSLQSYRNYVRNRGSRVECYFQKNGMLFLSWEGKVWPCCFISNLLYDSESKIRMFEKYFVSRYPEDFNSLHHHSLDDILAGPLFKKDLVKSWANPEERLNWRCVEKCSVAQLRESDRKPDDRQPLENSVFKPIYF